MGIKLKTIMKRVNYYFNSSQSFFLGIFSIFDITGYFFRSELSKIGNKSVKQALAEDWGKISFDLNNAYELQKSRYVPMNQERVSIVRGVEGKSTFFDDSGSKYLYPKNRHNKVKC